MTKDHLPSASNAKLLIDLGDEAQLLWNEMHEIDLDEAHLRANRIVTAQKNDPVHKRFDMLRTRLLIAMREHGWTRIAVTGVTEGCGASFVSANLALSVARMESVRTVLFDMHFTKPSLAALLGVKNPGRLSDYLAGHIAPEEYLIRVGQSLALGLNDTKVYHSSELIQQMMTTDVLSEMQDLLCPDMVIFDLPSVLDSDDVLGFLPNVDGVLLVVGGGQSLPEEVQRAEQALGDKTQLLGVVLNKAESLFS
ncbi:CpsD/CapB family tyrosine-protein kinase [Cognatishimia maritima]|uniref:Chromosome partitioning ATPase, Mrp family, contains Fe-S cluster n=1 Tax=Cognatishimia maritima TaxID=870908 RepID=A0A1M5TT88_9RHOB|nr:CpsD/CapB family tyrosine-protein kinase [Cognatishimia maritima]SHH54035.1 Chromosome partitioning ATPase, Mrp family, contains Fe-S cluster [Cognatishimia maritima]